ncbi:hypothetical protein Tco_1192435, partial [Tanacetum coccineum]
MYYIATNSCVSDEFVEWDLMKEGEVKEKVVEEVKEKAVEGCLDILSKVDELKHA